MAAVDGNDGDDDDDDDDDDDGAAAAAADGAAASGDGGTTATGTMPGVQPGGGNVARPPSDCFSSIMLLWLALSLVCC